MATKTKPCITIKPKTNANPLPLSPTTAPKICWVQSSNEKLRFRPLGCWWINSSFDSIV